MSIFNFLRASSLRFLKLDSAAAVCPRRPSWEPIFDQSILVAAERWATCQRGGQLNQRLQVRVGIPLTPTAIIVISARVPELYLDCFVTYVFRRFKVEV